MKKEQKQEWDANTVYSLLSLHDPPYSHTQCWGGVIYREYTVIVLFLFFFHQSSPYSNIMHSKNDNRGFISLLHGRPSESCKLALYQCNHNRHAFARWISCLLKASKPESPTGTSSSSKPFSTQRLGVLFECTCQAATALSRLTGEYVVS